MKPTLTDIDLQALEAGLTKGHRLAAATHAAPETIGQIIERLRGLETDHTPDGWPAVRMRDITALIAHIDGHHSEDKLDMVGRWYMVNKDGMATLCVDREDAEAEARKADREWPRNGPHRAVQLAEAQATALAKPYCHEDCMAYTAGIEKELQDAQAAARPTPTHLEAMERAWLWMENQADSQSKGGHETFDLMMLREERDALRAAIDAAPTTQPAPQQEAQEPVAWQYRSMPDMGGVWFQCTKERADQRAAHPEKWEVRALYTAPQPSPAAQGDALSDDAVRVPLDSLHADAAYLIGRLREGSMPYARVIEIIRERIDAAKAAIRARAEQGDALDAACQRACMELPEGMIMAIQLERHAGWIELHDSDGEQIELPYADGSLAERMHEAVNAARARLEEKP